MESTNICDYIKECQAPKNIFNRESSYTNQTNSLSKNSVSSNYSNKTVSQPILIHENRNEPLKERLNNKNKFAPPSTFKRKLKIEDSNNSHNFKGNSSLILEITPLNQDEGILQKQTSKLYEAFDYSCDEELSLSEEEVKSSTDSYSFCRNIYLLPNQKLLTKNKFHEKYQILEVTSNNYEFCDGAKNDVKLEPFIQEFNTVEEFSCAGDWCGDSSIDSMSSQSINKNCSILSISEEDLEDYCIDGNIQPERSQKSDEYTVNQNYSFAKRNDYNRCFSDNLSKKYCSDNFEAFCLKDLKEKKDRNIEERFASLLHNNDGDIERLGNREFGDIQLDEIYQINSEDEAYDRKCNESICNDSQYNLVCSDEDQYFKQFSSILDYKHEESDKLSLDECSIISKVLNIKLVDDVNCIKTNDLQTQESKANNCESIKLNYKLREFNNEQNSVKEDKHFEVKKCKAIKTKSSIQKINKTLINNSSFEENSISLKISKSRKRKHKTTEYFYLLGRKTIRMMKKYYATSFKSFSKLNRTKQSIKFCDKETMNKLFVKYVKFEFRKYQNLNNYFNIESILNSLQSLIYCNRYNKNDKATEGLDFEETRNLLSKYNSKRLIEYFSDKSHALLFSHYYSVGSKKDAKKQNHVDKAKLLTQMESLFNSSNEFLPEEIKEQFEIISK